ncbi:MAG: glycosyltransferase [Parcubacteria group bacterium]|jgi:glycosyltransferase involved in cell wall biosynthesis
MKIGIFTNNYLPNPYGVSTSIETFRRDFERLGHQVFIFAPRWPGYIDENPNVFRYPSIDIEFKFRFPLPIPYSWKMRRILKNLNLDIIHSQHPNLLGSAAIRWAKKKKIPLVFTWHTLYDKYVNFVPFVPPKIAAGFIIRRAVKFANQADAVIVPTDSIIPILQRWGVKNKNIVPIATGVIEENFKNADKNLVRNKYGIKDDETLLLLVSRLTAEKNILFVINAVKNILKNNKESSPEGRGGYGIKLLIVGGGYLSQEIIKLAEKEGIAEKIILTGEIENKNIANYFAAGNIFVYGSKSETQGMVMTEAMFSGLPVVAVNATGTSSLIKNNINGFLVSENKKEFAEAVEKLIADKNLRQKFGEASKKIARENFTSCICAKKMLEVYNKAILEKSE